MLRQTTITIMENEVCETPKNLLTSRMICAGELNPVHSSCYVNFIINCYIFLLMLLFNNIRLDIFGLNEI